MLQDIRNQFPILGVEVHGRQLVYFDNAATTQKPLAVIEALDGYYRSDNANIHRGAHHLAAVATEAYEGVRRQVQALIGARHAHEIVFTRGTTESINLVASSFARRYFKGDGDEVIVSGMEHHSNIVPWQLAGAVLRPVPFSDDGVLDLEAMERAEMEKRLETTRMDLLQSQIKPHFLFNTLNSISGMAEIEDAEVTDSMIRSLSRLFRYNLHTSDQFVSLSQELEVARDYLYLQKMRFGDRVQYEVLPEPGSSEAQKLGDINVPVFLLQPLVENAVLHGIAKKEQDKKKDDKK